MAKVTTQQAKVIQRCQQSVTWFLRTFGKLKHPSAGILPFNPFSYQREALKNFRQHRLNIFRKCRQSGISKISGAFAIWFAMFNPNKTILIVSRRNEDAMSFLRDHVVFVFEHLPQWMQEVWRPIKQNEHEIVFPNGSSIRSLVEEPVVEEPVAVEEPQGGLSLNLPDAPIAEINEDLVNLLEGGTKKKKPKKSPKRPITDKPFDDTNLAEPE